MNEGSCDFFNPFCFFKLILQENRFLFLQNENTESVENRLLSVSVTVDSRNNATRVNSMASNTVFQQKKVEKSEKAQRTNGQKNRFSWREIQNITVVRTAKTNKNSILGS